MSETAHTLDAIRVAELEAARRIEQAKDDAEAAVAAAQRGAAQAVADARRKGREEAKRRFDATIAAAKEEAAAILAGCDARLQDLRRSAAPHVTAAVTEMVDLLLAPPLEEGK